MYVYEGYRIPETKNEITMFQPDGCPSSVAVLVNNEEPNRVIKTPYWDEDIDNGLSMDAFIRTARSMVDGSLLFMMGCGKRPVPSFLVNTGGESND